MNLFMYRCIILIVSLLSCQTNSNSNRFYVKRTYYGAKLEDSVKIINGAGQDLMGLYDYVKTTRTMPKMYMDYASLANMPEVSNLRMKSTLIPKTAILQLGLNLTANINGRDKPIDKWVTFRKYDTEIDHLVNTLHELDRPILIRIGFEFDAPWNGYTPVYYKQTFIRITTALRKAGVNAATVWCSAGGGTGKFRNLNYIMSYYPGSEYVDWIGVNLFETKDFTALTQTSPLTTFLAKADELGKPVLIGESTPKDVGVLDGSKSWNKWFVPYFSLVQKTSSIKAISYINWNWEDHDYGRNWNRWGDARLHMNAYVNEKFINELRTGPFLNN